MEILASDRMERIKRLKNKESIQTEDTLPISVEAKKRAAWVEMLKQMPDMRMEKINRAATCDSSSFPVITLAVVAERIADSGF